MKMTTIKLINFSLRRYGLKVSDLCYRSPTSTFEIQVEVYATSSTLKLEMKIVSDERSQTRFQSCITSPQPSRHVRRKGAAALSGAEEQTARAISAHAQCACLLSLQMGSINQNRLDQRRDDKLSIRRLHQTVSWLFYVSWKGQLGPPLFCCSTPKFLLRVISQQNRRLSSFP